MLNLHCSLYDIDNTSVSSLFGLLGYLARSSRKIGAPSRLSGRETIRIGNRTYIKKTADEVDWL